MPTSILPDFISANLRAYKYYLMVKICIVLLTIWVDHLSTPKIGHSLFLLLGNTYFDDFSLGMSFSYWFLKFFLNTLENYKSFVSSIHCSLSELLFSHSLQCLLITDVNLNVSFTYSLHFVSLWGSLSLPWSQKIFFPFFFP